VTRRLSVERIAPWVARVAWLLVAVIGGAAIQGAVDGRSAAVRWTASTGGWAAWAIVMGCLLIAAVRSLTVVRIGAPLGVVAAVAAGIGGATAVQLIALVLPLFVTLAAVYTAEFGRAFVQASAYGDEQRYPLRPPAGVLVAAIVLWLAWAAAVVGAPLLVAARSWIAGVVLAVVAVAGLVLLVPRWHLLTLRWLVFVPAGLVVHDPVVLADTLSVRRTDVTRIGLAPGDTGAADLTGPASGYAVQVETATPTTAVFAPTRADPSGRAVHMTAFLICPSRPGRALAGAADNTLPVG
jgi:hypothetical protein